MPWSYRVFHTCYKAPHEADVTHDYSVRETYYGEDGALTAISAKASWASGETVTELMKDHARIQEAFSRPILTPQDIPGYQYAAGEVVPET